MIHEHDLSWCLYHLLCLENIQYTKQEIILYAVVCVSVCTYTKPAWVSRYDTSVLIQQPTPSVYPAVTILTWLKKQIAFKQAVTCNLSLYWDHLMLYPHHMDKVIMWVNLSILKSGSLSDRVVLRFSADIWVSFHAFCLVDLNRLTVAQLAVIVIIFNLKIITKAETCQAVFSKTFLLIGNYCIFLCASYRLDNWTPLNLSWLQSTDLHHQLNLE